ncbi:SAF domain-containing protein [Cohnella sp.]|uniref:SAF domain-containing protein n=1 Tax=Cohnella sp. TaxID=1883426 RepID=UPI00257DBBEA|nr:SAF domain-containing protein [Cohnella sp.]
MNRKRQIAISLSAALLSGVVVYGVYLLQLRQIRLEETVQVVAPKQFVPAGSTLERGMLTEVSLPRSAVTKNMVTRAADVVGMQTHAPLGTLEPILDWKVDRYPLLPRPGEATFQIPREYVKSVSNGIRAGEGFSSTFRLRRGPPGNCSARPSSSRRSRRRATRKSTTRKIRT